VTELSVSEADGVSFVEGRPGEPFMTSADDAGRIVEACWSQRTSNALLYLENLSPGFFDLSSRDAGAVLQRLRNYGIRLVIVCAPGQVRFSSRFGEMVAEEQRGRQFAIVESRAAAVDWLRA
jgi:hypothetical protein